MFVSENELAKNDKDYVRELQMMITFPCKMFKERSILTIPVKLEHLPE